VAARVLIDTNVFLEVLLEQKRWRLCEDILRKNIGESALTDFALHSIGVVLLGRQKSELLQAFLDDILVHNALLTLPSGEFSRLIALHRTHRLGFDDAYQLAVAEHFGLGLITIDRHFAGIDSAIKITVLE
jgi:predicted nucleic acid-binding protein